MQAFLWRLAFVLASVVCVDSNGHCQADPQSFRIARQATPFGNSAFALALDARNSRVAISGYRGTIAVYDANTLSELTKLDADQGMVLRMAFDTNQRHLLVTGDPKQLRVYRTADWQLLRTIDLPFRCGFLATHPHRPIVALAGTGNRILFYDYESGQSLGEMDHKLQRAFDLAFTPNGENLLAIAKTEGMTVSPHNLIAIDTDSLRQSSFRLSAPAYRVLANSYAEFSSLTLSPDATRFAVIDKGGKILIFDSATLATKASIAGEFAECNAMAFTSSDELLVAGEGEFSQVALSSDSEPVITQMELVSKINHLLLDPLTGRIFASHARAKNQLTVWSSQSVSSGAPPKPAQLAEMTPAPSLAKDDPSREPNVDQPNDAGRTMFLPSQLSEREWTDATSGQTVKAHLVGIDGDDVLLRMPNTKEYVLPRTRLSDSDQDYLLQVETLYPEEINWNELRNDPIASGFCSLRSIQIQHVTKNSDPAESSPADAVTAPARNGFAVTRSVPDKRGGFYLATTKGLAKYNPTKGLILLITGAPTLEHSQLPTLIDSVQDLVVDRFGRAIVRFEKSSQAFRWNGFDWIHLWSDPPHIRSLINTKHGIYAIAKQQPPHTLAKLAIPENYLVHLRDDDRWHTLDVTYDGQSVMDLEMVFPLNGNRLLGIRENQLPIVIENGTATTIDAPELTAHKLGSVTASLPGPAIDLNGRIYFIRTPRETKSFGRAEVVRIDSSGTHAWNHDAAFFDQNQPNQIAVNHLGQVLVGMRNGNLFSAEEDSKLNSAAEPAQSSYHVDDSLLADYLLRDMGLMARTLSPFVHTRTWTSTRGTRLNAVCEELHDQRARLRDTKGRTIDVSFEDLTDLDKEYLSNIAWHRAALRNSTGSLQVISRRRTRRGTFTNWDKMPEAERAAILPMIFDISINPDVQADVSNFIATTRGLETWHRNELRLLSPAPKAVQGADPNAPAAWQELLATADGSVLGIFDNTGQVFEYRGQWELSKGAEHFRLSRLKLCGNTVYGVAIYQPPGKAKAFGIATFDRVRGWTMQIELSQTRETQQVTSIGNTVPLDKNRIAIAWLCSDVQKNGIQHPGNSVITTHPINQRSIVTSQQLAVAESVLDQFGGPAVATNGLLMLRTTKTPQRLLRWCFEEPLSTAVIASTDTLRELPLSNDFAFQEDGTIWSVHQGTITRMGSDGMITFENGDGSAIDVGHDGTVYVQGDYLTVMKYNASP